MAANCKHFRKVLPLVNPSCLWRSEGYRLYSMYPSHYEKPVFQKDKIEQLLKENDPKDLSFISRKAPENCHTSSVFFDEDLTKFINLFTRRGKKELARTTIENVFTRIKHNQLRKYNAETDEEKKKEILLRPLDVFRKAVENVTPVVTVRSVRKSGSWYKVPTSITPHSAKIKAMKWLILSAKEKDMKIPIVKSLTTEILGASQYEGKAIAKKIELHKLCEANRSYAHYRSG